MLWSQGDGEEVLVFRGVGGVDGAWDGDAGDGPALGSIEGEESVG